MLKLTLESVIKKFRSVHGDLYDYSKVQYVSGVKHVIITCKKHGDFSQAPRKHSAGNGCPSCAIDKQRSDPTLLVEKFKEIHGNTYGYSKVKYINNVTKINIICKKHGSFKQRPKDHLRGYGCPTCQYPKGELIIRNYLSSCNINFIEQYPLCKNEETNAMLKADFFLPDYNLVIEFDGRQHFQMVPSFGGYPEFIKTKQRDQAKNNFCKENNINLCRIPYYLDKRIETIVNNYMKHIKDKQTV